MVFPADVAFKFEEAPAQIVDGVAVTGLGAAMLALNVNIATLVPVPKAVVTATVPVVPEPMIAVIDVGEFTVND